MEKTCKKCGTQAAAEKFPSAGWTNGKQYRRNICMDCYWHKVKKVRRDSNAKWFQAYKATLSCKVCGNSDHRVLDFHHLDRNAKEFNISNAVITGIGRKRIIEEIAKCECLCANCHRICTYDDRMAEKRLS